MEALTLDKASFTAGVKWEDKLEEQVYRVGGQVIRNVNSAFYYTGRIVNDDAAAIVQWGGNYPNLKGRCRFEWNPNHESYQYQQLLKRLGLFLDDREPMTVTRLDFAIDYRLPFSALEVEYKHGVSRQFHTGRSGEVETVYYGSRSSDYRLRLYNKAVEQGAPFLDWSRLEAQMRGSWSLDQLAERGLDCFHGVKLYNNFVQGTIDSEMIPVEYKALLYYLEKFPWEEGKLGRVKRKKLSEYRELQKKEIDIQGVVARDMSTLMEGFTKKLGYVA